MIDAGARVIFAITRGIGASLAYDQYTGRLKLRRGTDKGGQLLWSPGRLQQQRRNWHGGIGGH